MMIKFLPAFLLPSLLISGWLVMSLMVILPAYASDVDQEEHGSHGGHSDALLILLGHKIALQKLQNQFPITGLDAEIATNLSEQGRRLKIVMPVLNSYMATPKSYYLTTSMYHDSLENRAAMLADFSNILLQYQKQLVSKP